MLPALRHKKHHHEERKRNPCPQRRIRIPTCAIITCKTSLEHATADVDNERGHTLPQNILMQNKFRQKKTVAAKINNSEKWKLQLHNQKK